MESKGQRFVVIVDAIVGQGCVYQQGHVLGADHFWGYTEWFLQEGAIRALPQYSYELEPTPGSVHLC